MATKLNHLTVSGDFENLAVIGDFVNRAAAEAKLDDRATYAMQMAVDEACTNIIEHAYRGEGRGQIELRYEVRQDGLEIVILDQGAPFDPEEVADLDTTAPLSERSKRGMGIFFIRRLVDQVEYEFDTPRGNQLTLFKRQEQDDAR